MLSESLWIEHHDIHLRGESSEVTILVCPEDDNILNIACVLPGFPLTPIFTAFAV